MKCPICDSELIRDFLFRDETGLTEESCYSCKDCKMYIEEYSYGTTIFVIFDEVFCAYYDDSKEDRYKSAKLYENAVEYAKSIHKRIILYRKAIGE